MSTSLSKSFRYAYVCDIDDIRAIYSLFSSNYDSVKISFLCSDDSSISGSDLISIESFENISTRAIREINLTGQDVYPKNNSSTVTLKSGWISGINYSISDADDAKALIVRDQLVKRFISMRPWYWFVAKFSLYELFFAGSAVFTL